MKLIKALRFSVSFLLIFALINSASAQLQNGWHANGMAVFSSSDLDPDNFDNFKNGIHGHLVKNPRPDDAWGMLAAWAWGASRCMDYLITDKDVAVNNYYLIFT